MTTANDFIVPMILGIKKHMEETGQMNDTRKARHTIEALSRVTQDIITMTKDRPELEESQPYLQELIATGKEISNQVPFICPECDEPHHDSATLCTHCKRETELASQDR